MRLDTYVLYLEAVVLSLLAERPNPDAEIASVDDARDSWKPPITFSPFAIRDSIRDSRNATTSQRTRLLVLTEKHYNRYFDATTDEQLHEVALFILQKRFDEGHWYYEPKQPQAEKYGIDFTEEDIAKLPLSLQENAKEKWNIWKMELAQYKEDQLEWAAINKALDTKNGELAWRILRDRSDYEYEGVELETCEEPK